MERKIRNPEHMRFVLDLRRGLSASHSKFGILKDEPKVVSIVVGFCF